MTTAILFNHVNTVQIHTQDLTDDQLEMVSGGVNETCRRVPVGNPAAGVYDFICKQYKN